MNPNNLHLRFGRKLPDGAVNLAYIQVPDVSPSDNVLVASHIAKLDANTADYSTEEISSSMAVSAVVISCPSTGAGFNTTTVDSTSIKQFTAPISIVTPEETPSNSWLVRLENGVIQQDIVYNPAVSGTYDSWLHRLGFTEEKNLRAFYTLQESATCRRLSYDDTNPQDRFLDKVYRETAYITSNTTAQTVKPDIYSIEGIYLNNRLISSEDIYYITSDESSALRGGRSSSTGAKALVDVATGEITFKDCSVSLDDTITVSYTYNTSTYTYRGFFETVTTSGSDKQIFRDLNLNPEFGQTYDNGTPTSELTRQCTSIYLLPSAVYDLDLAQETGQITLYRAVDYGEYSLIRWTSASIQTHYEVSGYQPWDSKITTTVDVKVYPTSGSIPVGRSMDFACKVTGTNYPIVSVNMDSLGGTIDPGTITGLSRNGNVTTWTYNAPYISTASGVPYNMVVKWEKVGTVDGVSALKQINVPITVTSDIGITLTLSEAGSAVSRFSNTTITPYITGGYGNDPDLIWVIYNGSTVSSTHGSLWPEDPYNPGVAMASSDLARYGFTTNYSYAGTTVVKGPAFITIPDSNGYPTLRSVRMIYTPPSSPDGGTTRWGYDVKIRAYSHYDQKRYGEVTLGITSGITVGINPASTRAFVGSTQRLEVTVYGSNRDAGDSGALTWSCSGVNATGGAITVTDPVLYSGPISSGTDQISTYNFAVPAVSGYFALKATSVQDTGASFTAYLTGCNTTFVSIPSVTGSGVLNTHMPDIYDLEPGHVLQVTALVSGGTPVSGVLFTMCSDSSFTNNVTGALYGTISATGNPAANTYTCTVTLPSSFITAGRSDFYLKATYGADSSSYAGIGLHGLTGMSWNMPSSGYYNSAIPYTYNLVFTNICTGSAGVSAAMTRNGSSISAASTAWTGGPAITEFVTGGATLVTEGTFGNMTVYTLPVRVNTPFSSAGTDTYTLSVNATAVPSGTYFSGVKKTLIHSKTVSITPIISNWSIEKVTDSGYVAPDGSGGYILSPGELLYIGAAVKVAGRSIESYYTGYNISYPITGMSWTCLEGEHAASGTLTAHVSGANYQAPAVYDPTFKTAMGDGWYKKAVDIISVRPSAVSSGSVYPLNMPVRIDSMVRSITLEPATEADKQLVSMGLVPGDSITLKATVNYDGTSLSVTGCLWNITGLTGTFTFVGGSTYTSGAAESLVYTVPSSASTTEKITDTIIVTSACDSDIQAQIAIPINFALTPIDIIPNPSILRGKYGEAVYGKYRFS